jgi:hypothetical protein
MIKHIFSMCFCLDLIQIPCSVALWSLNIDLFCVGSHNSHMSADFDRRHMMLGSSAWATGLGVGANVLTPNTSHAGLFGKSPSAFDTIMRASTGAVPANFSDFAVQSPEGNTCTARLAFPMVLSKKLPVLIFCPDEGANAVHYDRLTGALAAQNFFVVAIDRRPVSIQPSRATLAPQQVSDQNLRRFAEARFLLDTIDAAAAALGPKADLVDTSRVGAIGHGDGAWIAAGLGGWDSSGAASTRTRDGRVYAVLGLLPSRSTTATNVAAQRSPDGVSGMFVGGLAQMPVPERGSGLLGLGLPYQSTTFGGLIGTPITTQSRRVPAEPQALAAAVASAVLFFDWALRGDGQQKKELMALDGRRVDGLTAPLQLRKA